MSETKFTPHPIDLAVGATLRQRRRSLGISQQALAAALGITFQQVQKYERAANRISASNLFALAQVLNCSVEFFFKDVEDGPPSDNTLNLATRRFLATDEGRELLTLMAAIDDAEVRTCLVRLSQALQEAAKTPHE